MNDLTDKRITEIFKKHAAPFADAPFGPAPWVLDAMRSAVKELGAVPAQGQCPEFVVQRAELAIHAAKNPQGMHTNGPCLAHIVVTDLELLLRYAQSAAPAAPVVAASEQDPIRKLLAKHAEMLEDGPYAHYCYFELAFTRSTGWMAWICSNFRDDDPSRKILAKGQGDTSDEACQDALADLAARANQEKANG